MNVSASSTQNVTLTNAGNSVITISNVTVSGAGFNATGASGVILNPGQTTTVSATFTPAAAGSVTGSSSSGQQRQQLTGLDLDDGYGSGGREVTRWRCPGRRARRTR